MKDEVLVFVDCSNRRTVIGVAVNGEAVADFCEDQGREQAARLPLEVERLLAEAGKTVNDITYLAVGIGPGYFTGIRIGMAYVAALAYALSVPVVPVSSLDVVLHSDEKWNQGVKVPVIAASRELAFSSVWHNGVCVAEEKERSYDEVLRDAENVASDFEIITAKDARLFAKTPEHDVDLIKVKILNGRRAAIFAWNKRSEGVKPSELKARYLREPGLGRSL